MSKMLQELQKLKPKFPEVEFHVPEWDRSVRLRGFSLREGRDIRKRDENTDDEQLMVRTLAYAIVDDQDRPLANEEGIALLESLSPKTLQEMGQAFMQLSGADADTEGNSATMAVADGSSDSPSHSDARSLN